MIIGANKIITGNSDIVLNHGALRIDYDGKICEVGKKEEVTKKYPKEECCDYGNATILPGLIDMHVHLGYPWSKPDSFQYNDYLVAYLALKSAQDAFSAGVTTVRDVGSPNFLCQKLRLASKKGYFVAPRIIHCDMGICMSGGHGWILEGGVVQADGEDEIRKEIRKQFSYGADWIKILTSHRTETPEFTQKELDAAVDECHRVNRKVAVHAGTQPSIAMAIQAGFDTIEHGTFMTEEQACEMKSKGLTWVPTIIAYTYIYEELTKKMENGIMGGATAVDEEAFNDYEYFKRAAESYRKSFKKLADTGVNIVAGTDMVLDGSPPMPIARELQYMVDYGWEPIKAITAATYNSAKVLGMEDKIGSLSKNRIADILVVDGDATEDITALQKVVEVFLEGKSVYHR